MPEAHFRNAILVATPVLVRLLKDGYPDASMPAFNALAKFTTHGESGIVLALLSLTHR